MRFRLRSVVLMVLAVVSVDAVAALPSAQDFCAAQSLQAMFAPSVLDELRFAADFASRAHPSAPARDADPRRLLVDFAMTLRDIRYRRGGRSPHSGFDCSGFVHYVFAQVLGVELPENSAAQYADADSTKIARDDLQAGDLVFFRTRGKREILAKWLQRQKQISAKNLEASSWRFAPLKTHGPVTFTAAADKLGVAKAAGLDNIRQVKDHGDGTATYAIDLSH